MNPVEKLLKLVEEAGLTVSFSVNCCSGLVPKYAERCECWRCRKSRGETPDEELAASISQAATAQFYKDTRKFLAGLKR